MTFARIHQYLSMATPLLWTRQPDTIGVLGLALNAATSANGNGHRRSSTRSASCSIAARDLWRVCPRSRTRGEAHGVSRTTFRLDPPRRHRGGDRRLPELTRQRRALRARRAGRALARRVAARRPRADRHEDRAAARATAARARCSSTACPTLSCITLVHTVGDREVTTIEGLRDHPLVDAFVRADALQCGFCTPGQIVSAAALVEAEPEPTPRRDPARDGRQHLPLRHLSRRSRRRSLTWQD